MTSPPRSALPKQLSFWRIKHQLLERQAAIKQPGSRERRGRTARTADSATTRGSCAGGAGAAGERTMLQWRSKALTRASSLRLLRQLIRTCSRPALSAAPGRAAAPPQQAVGSHGACLRAHGAKVAGCCLAGAAARSVQSRTCALPDMNVVCQARDTVAIACPQPVRSDRDGPRTFRGSTARLQPQAGEPARDPKRRLNCA
jgi:hypothetical protein